MSSVAIDILKSSIDTLEELMDNMEDRGDFYDEDGRPFSDANALKIVHAHLSGLAGSLSKHSRVLVIVAGGVADYIADDSVEVEVFDFDNYEADPAGTELPSESFRHLAEKSPQINNLYTKKVA